MRSRASTTLGSRRSARPSSSTDNPSAPSARCHCSCSRQRDPNSSYFARVDAHDSATERHVETAAQGPLAIAHGLGHDRRHPLVPFEAGDLDRLGTRGGHLGHERCRRGQLDARLAERWQHLLDVAEEEAVGPHDEHALALEQEPMGVEEVGGPVERDRGLARARAALHDEHPGERRPDDLVLLGLDRGHDVAHVARARPLERGEQRRGAGQETVAFGAGRARDGSEQLVLQIDDATPLGDEVAPAPQSHRMAAGGPVERLRRRHPLTRPSARLP